MSHILDARPHRAKSFADKLNLSFATTPNEVKGVQLRAAVDVSPATRRQLQIWSLAAQLNGQHIKKCERHLEIYDKIGCVWVGIINRAANE